MNGKMNRLANVCVVQPTLDPIPEQEIRHRYKPWKSTGQSLAARNKKELLKRMKIRRRAACTKVSFEKGAIGHEQLVIILGTAASLLWVMLKFLLFLISVPFAMAQFAAGARSGADDPFEMDSFIKTAIQSTDATPSEQ